MMDYTDRHQRRLQRLISKQAVLYTEMVTTNAIVRSGDILRFLGADFPAEEPLVLQLGGSDPQQMKTAAKMAKQDLKRGGFPESFIWEALDSACKRYSSLLRSEIEGERPVNRPKANGFLKRVVSKINAKSMKNQRRRGRNAATWRRRRTGATSKNLTPIPLGEGPRNTQPPRRCGYPSHWGGAGQEPTAAPHIS